MPSKKTKIPPATLPLSLCAFQSWEVERRALEWREWEGG